MNTRVEIRDEDMVSLWKFMGDLYGAAFTSQYGTKVKEWKRHLTHLGLTPGHLEHGKEKCRQAGDVMPPNLSVFARLCRPTAEELGMPGDEEAYRLAVSIIGYLYSSHKPVPAEKWKHPVVWHAAKSVGFFEISRWPESKSRPAFIREYQKLIRNWVAGERYFIPDPIEKRLPSPPQFTEEELSEARTKLKKILGREPNWEPCKAMRE